MPATPFRPSRRHADLGPDFYDVVAAARFPAYILRHRNRAWAARVGLDSLTDEEWIAHFGRFVPLPGSVNVTFTSSPHAAKAVPAGVKATPAGDAADGFAKFKLDLSA